MLPSYAPMYDPAIHYDKDNSDDNDFGPKPLPARIQHQQTDAVKEFIERKEKQRKLAEVCSNLFYNFFLLMSYFLLSKTGCCQTQEPSTG